MKKLTKAECLEQRYYSDDYFTYSDDGYIYDNETGERVSYWYGIPPIVRGMKPAEREEFVEWAEECLSLNFANATVDEIDRAARLWYDDCYKLSTESDPTF